MEALQRFIPLHSLTGPVGQPFASNLGGQRIASWGCTNPHNGTGFLLLAQSRYIGEDDWSLASPQARSQQWEASLGFMPMKWNASCDHTLPSPVPFHSMHALLLLATQWTVRALVKLLGGGGPIQALQFHSTTQSHWSSGSTVYFPSRGSVVCVLGMHKPTHWNQVSPVSAYIYNGIVTHCRKKNNVDFLKTYQCHWYR